MPTRTARFIRDAAAHNLSVWKQVAAIANAEVSRLVKAAEYNELAALHARWKKDNGRLTPEGVAERERLKKAKVPFRQIAERMSIDESAARYTPRRKKG